MAEKKEQFDQIAGKLLEHDRRFDELNNKIEDKFGKILTKLDGVMGELEKAREDRVSAVGKDREQDRRLDGLEGRVVKLEAVGR